MATAFERAFKVVIGEEGGMSLNPADPGNWTGGSQGSGVLRGTKYGIAASAHPTLNIVALTLEEAQAIYKTEYWDKMRGDNLPPTLALLVFDAAVNCGPSRAAKWLQVAVGVAQDGIIGPATLAAVESHRGTGATVCAEYMARRTVFMADLPTWRVFGLGWARRLCALPYHAREMIDG
jgi:lysozyme family protein